jgi:hypothetical protein
MSAKLANLYRALADVLTDIAEELEATEPANDPAPLAPKSRPRALRARPFPQPLSPVTDDLYTSRARRMIKKRGGV